MIDGETRKYNCDFLIQNGLHQRGYSQGINEFILIAYVNKY